MVIRKAIFAMAASALVLGSTAATAATSADLRTGSAVEGESLAGTSGFALIVALLIAAGVIGVIVADNDEDDAPTSP